MLFNNLAFLPGLTFFRRGLAVFLKRCLATLRLPTFFLPKAKIALRLPKQMTGSPLIKMTSASNYNPFMNLTPLP